MNVPDVVVSLPLPNVQEVVETALGVIQLARYVTLAFYVIVVYDWLISFSAEYDLIITARWTWMKFTYLLCRYIPLVTYPVYFWAWLDDHSPAICTPTVVSTLYGYFMIFFLLPQLVIMMRTYAFTGERRWVLAVLSTSFLAVAAADIWVFGTQFVYPTDLRMLVGDSGCFGDDKTAEARSFHDAPAILAGSVLLANFALDAFAIILIVVHAIRIRSTAKGSLGREFLSQSILAFLVISGVNLSSAISFFQAQRAYDTMTLPFTLVSDVMACHIILALRRKVNPTQTEVYRLQSRIVQDAMARLEDADFPTQDWHPQRPP